MVNRKINSYSIPLAFIFAPLICSHFEKRTYLWISVNPAKKNGIQFIIGLGIGFCSTFLVAIGFVLIGQIEYENFLSRLPLKEIISNLIYFFFVALGEEFLFRGYLLELSKERMSPKAAVILVSILFMIIHFVNPNYYWFAYLFAFLFGLLMSYVCIKLNSVWLGVGFHWIWNFMQGSIFAIPEQGGEIIYVLIFSVLFMFSLFLKVSNPKMVC